MKEFLTDGSFKDWPDFVSKYSRKFHEIPRKRDIVDFVKSNKIVLKSQITTLLRMKPMRTLSGVSIVTVFTKPYRCSGNCIYCPTVENVPKSYLPNEPAMQRAIILNYDPYLQVKKRIEALELNGHKTSKIEIIISGGTWDDYEEQYRINFVNNLFRALNKTPLSPPLKGGLRGVNEIYKSQEINESSENRCVGMSVETRPDKITDASLKFARKLGVTKMQIGIQSLDDDVLKLNCRGHSSKISLKAADLLRKYGFKIQIHWMPNLYGSTPEKDYRDFIKLFTKNSICPDEIKIYPCTVIENTSLHKLYMDGKYKSYSFNELLELLVKCKVKIPRYCRISRLYRDIPSNDIVSGSKYTNFRQMVEEYMNKQGLKCNCIRCREIKDEIKDKRVKIKETVYETEISDEHFLEFVDQQDRIYGFLRLSIYKNREAMIREVHVYGSSIPVGIKSTNIQHTGLGKELIKKAEEISLKNKCKTIRVISAVGTREYYRKLGYVIEKDGLGYGKKSLKCRT